MSASLLTHNTLYLIGILLNIGVILLVILISRKNLTSTVVTFILMSISVTVFQVSNLIGLNATSGIESKNTLMFSLSTIFIGIFLTHWFLALTGKVKKRLWPLIFIYATGLCLVAFFMINPNSYLLVSIPKLYFPFFYNPGALYVLDPIWFMLTGLYFFYESNASYKNETNPIEKNRLKYALISVIYGFIIGSTAYLPLFDIPFDPMWSALFGLYTIPLAYAIVRYELLDIRVFAKRAFVYLVTMICLGVVIGITNFIGNYILKVQPDFPSWIMPAILAILIGEGGIYLWSKARQEDRSKYEFVDLVTHKFRGPLTQIKWATDLISSESSAAGAVSENSKTAIETIQQATSKMTELTNALVAVDDTDSKKYTYAYKTFDLLAVVNNVVKEYSPRYMQKKIDIGIYATGVDTTAYGDPEKMKFAVDILVNNALIYTPQGGRVSIRFWQRGTYLEMIINDTGIGIPDDAAPFMFTKFYRAENAQRATVDGTGIGLYLANEIVKRNGGTLSYFSQGPTKGATFVIHLPVKI